MVEPVFRFAEMVIPRLLDVNGPHLTYHGLEHIPERGGALLAVNHIGYIDWSPASIAALRRGRRLRFMIKAEVADVAVGHFVVKHLGLIPVDRRVGADAYAVAVQRLRAGELVGVHPEATISRSFELMEFKTGAARMAHAAGVPIIPVVSWGIQRVWTKGHPRALWRNHIPVLAKVGAPMPASADAEQTGVELRRVMAELLDQAQQEYPHPAGAFWVPARLGGSAPTPAEAKRLRAAELAERARKRAERAADPVSGSRWRRAVAPVSRRR